MAKGALKRRIFERDGYRCQYCGRRVWRDAPQNSPRQATVDHVVPLSRGGTDDPANLVTCCVLCNQAKGDGYAKPHRRDGRDSGAQGI